MAAIQSQTRPADDVIVVDDSPRRELRALAGARVLGSGGQGPYAARNVGWRAADADVILFLDVRSRPRPDWALRLAEVFEDPAVAVAGSEVVVRGGRSLGARVSERQQFFQSRKYVTDGFFRPYFPTCNLALRREDLQTVGGFREIRSGADADVCWRVLERHGRRLATVPDVLMEWVPRDRLRDYFEQNYRYGKSHWFLRRLWREGGARQVGPMSHRLLARRIAGVTLRTARAAARGRDDEVTEQLRKGGRFAYHLGYRWAADRERWSE